MASIVPVIVNAILNEHQIIADIVAFVNKGDFPRSRLGEKQRGKILAGWVTRKMRTLAQFAIRDVDPAAMGDPTSGSGEGETSNRASTSSMAGPGMQAAATSSLRNMENAPQILEQDEFEQRVDQITDMEPVPADMYASHNDAAAAATTADFPFRRDLRDEPINSSDEDEHLTVRNLRPLSFGPTDMERLQTPNPPEVGPKPGAGQDRGGQVPPSIRLPGVDGRENLDLWSGSKGDDEEDDWQADAIMHMNLAGDMGPR